VGHQHVQVPARAPPQLPQVAAFPGRHAAAGEPALAADVDAVRAQRLDRVAAESRARCSRRSSRERGSPPDPCRAPSTPIRSPTPRTCAARTGAAACRGGRPASSRAGAGGPCFGSGGWRGRRRAAPPGRARPGWRARARATSGRAPAPAAPCAGGPASGSRSRTGGRRAASTDS
jgi:hypothetical protein